MVEDVTPEPGVPCATPVSVIEYVAPAPATEPEELSALEFLRNIYHEKQVEVDRCVAVHKRETEKLRLLEECSCVPPRDEVRRGTICRATRQVFSMKSQQNTKTL